MAQGGIFINYRGADSFSYGALLHAELSHRFGPELVFLDSESIPPGADFVAELLGRVRTARVLLAVIDARWLTAVGPGGGRCIDDPADWVRRELLEAFAAGVRVIPVLIDDAPIPAEADLPADIAALGRCQYRRLRRRDASGDLARLAAELARLDEHLGATGAARAASAVCSVPNQLPAATRYFTGRQEQLTRLLRPPEAGRTLMVSAVAGMAGIGKTALAVLAAHRLTGAGRYPDGTLFVELHGYSGRTPADPADALEVLLLGLGVPGPQIPANTDARAALYRTITARRKLLIVLDDASNETQVRPLLPGAPGCLVLVTSRRRLAGLDEADHITLETLTPAEATELFRTVAGARQQAADDRRTTERIVELCGLLPLAVRIAAARLRTSPALTGRALLDQLRSAHAQDRLGALDDGERSVSAALEVSYCHLTAEQQRAFAALGMHPGTGLEPYAAAALLDTDHHQAARLLAALEQVNLLDQPAPGRYRFHDLTRIHAVTRHSPTPADAHAALDRLCGHYAHTASAAMDAAYPYETGQRPRAPTSDTPRPDVADRASALAWLGAELPNLLAAARHAVPDRPAHTLHQSSTLRRHLRTCGAYTEARALHSAAAILARAAGDRPAEVTALTGLGQIDHLQGRYDSAADHHARALELARAVGDTNGALTALNGLGRTHHAHGRYEQAASCHLEALAQARATGNPGRELDALTGLGWIHWAQGRYVTAAEHHGAAVQVARRTDNPAGEITALNGLGEVHNAQGDHQAAAGCFTRTLMLARAGHDAAGELNALTGLGHAYHLQGRHGPAVDCHAAALELARATGHIAVEIDALTGLGSLHREQRRHDAARHCYQQALDLAQTIGDHNRQYEAHLGLGRVHQAAGHLDLAITTHETALDLARELDQAIDQVRALDGLAHAHRGLGHPDQARRCWRHALDLLTRLGSPTAWDVTATAIHTHLIALDTPAPARPTDTSTPSR